MKVNRKDGARRESRAKGHAGISRQERTPFLAAAIVAYHGERNEMGTMLRSKTWPWPPLEDLFTKKRAGLSAANSTDFPYQMKC
jgi:hypothetical protein